MRLINLDSYHEKFQQYLNFLVYFQQFPFSKSDLGNQQQHYIAQLPQILKTPVGIGTTTTGFFPGEDIKGLDSGALYSVSAYDKEDTNDKYNEGDIFETEADSILDFTESNPFGTY